MKPNLNCLPGHNATRIVAQSKRLILPFSLQMPARQVHFGATVNSSFRIPVLPQNQAYLKALRQAELAAWNSAKPTASASRPAAPRLPVPQRERQENWMYALLTLVCLGLFVRESCTLIGAAGNWHHFLEFVRSLLS